jgi:hypothetical protein
MPDIMSYCNDSCTVFVLFCLGLIKGCSMCKVIPNCNCCAEIMGGCDQVLGTDELNAYLSKYRLELDPHLEALVGRSVLKLSQLILLA